MFCHGTLRLEVFNDPMFQENGYLLWVEGRPAAWIIDPGLPPQPPQMLAALRQHGLTPEAIVLTHCHFDHIAGIAPLRAALGAVPVICPRDEADMLEDAHQNLSAALGYSEPSLAAQLGLPLSAPAADRLVAAGDELELSGLRWKALDVCGHSPGGLGYYSGEAGVLLVGDAVFAESIGRYDFPHSSRRKLIANIRDNVLTLPGKTIVYSGHGPPATVAEIKSGNQTLRWELDNLGG